LRAHRFKDLFGFQAWSPARREMVGKLLSDEGVVVQPPLEQAGRDDWLVFSMPALGVRTAAPPEPRPTAEWFAHKAGLRLGSEREVELHFVSPLFEQLGYREEQEAAGFGFVMWEGVRQHNVEADLLYFASDVHDVAAGDPLVLVECKAVGKGPDAGLGQARSYAYWLKPAYYLVTDGDYLTVWNYQGGAVPDLRVCEARRATLSEKFDELHAVLNPQTALATRQQKIKLLTGSQNSAVSNPMTAGVSTTPVPGTRSAAGKRAGL
jgi:type I restriction and modification enzyme subunit R-like protein